MTNTGVEIRTLPVWLFPDLIIAGDRLKTKPKTVVGLIGSATPCRHLGICEFAVDEQDKDEQGPFFMHIFFYSLPIVTVFEYRNMNAKILHYSLFMIRCSIFVTPFTMLHTYFTPV